MSRIQSSQNNIKKEQFIHKNNYLSEKEENINRKKKNKI